MGEGAQNPFVMSRDRALGRTFMRAIGITMAVILVVAIAGYALFRIQTPVSLDDTVDRFRSGNNGVTSGSYEVDPPEEQGVRTEAKKSPRRKGEIATARGASTDIGARPVAAETEASPASKRNPATSFDVMPAEGVYSYEGSGKEHINGIERDFPPESHRIITHEDRDTWEEHHIFSEERESWTRLSSGPTGRLAHSQRNLVGIAGYTVRDTDVPFRPALRAVRFPHQVGHSWSGRFEGRSEPDGDDYTGTYRVRVIGDEKWRVGGTTVRVLGHEMNVEFEGEVEALVTVRYWFAPLHGITAKEYYSIDAKIDGLSYRAEWDVRLLSLIPQS